MVGVLKHHSRYRFCKYILDQQILTKLTWSPSSNNNLCKKIILQILCNPCLVVFLSLLMRMLLLRSGNVKSNPGPRPNSFSIGCWNVDSLLSRESVKKDYLESIQSIHHFDLFGICETYLNTSKFLK